MKEKSIANMQNIANKAIKKLVDFAEFKQNIKE